MKKTFFLFLVFINSIYSQTYLNENWLHFTEDNSPLKSNKVIDLFPSINGGYWILSYSGKDSTYTEYLQYNKNGELTDFNKNTTPLHSSRILDMVETKDGKLLFATDKGLYILEGEKWDSITINNSPIHDGWIYTITVDKNGRYWMGFLLEGFMVYDDGEFTEYNDDNSFFGIGDFNFAVADSTNNIWIGTDYYGLDYFNGSEWKKVITSEISHNDSTNLINGLAVDSKNNKWASILNLSEGAKVAKIEDDTLVTYFTNIPIDGFPTYDGIVIDSNDVKYVGSWHGLVVYNDTTWTRLDTSNSPLPANSFEEGIVDEYNNKTYILESREKGEHYGFVVYNEKGVTITSNEEQQTVLPAKFILYPNYPNPFNPTTNITYALPARADVKISVYNVLGEEVKVLLNENKSAGYHSVEFNAGKNISSGVYIYQIDAKAVNGEHFTESRKMMLLK